MTVPLVVQDVMDVEYAVEPLTEASPKEAVEQLIKGPVDASPTHRRGFQMDVCNDATFSANHRTRKTAIERSASPKR